MKNTIKFLEAVRNIAIIAFVAVIGFSMMSCDLEEETLSLQGSWKSSFFELTISGNNFTLHSSSGGYDGRGTYTATATHISFYPTQSYDKGKASWVDFDTSNLYHTNTFHGGFSGNTTEKPYKIEKDGNGIKLTLFGLWAWKE